MESRNQRYEPALDHVRAFAASWIVLYHSFQLISARLLHDSNFDPSRDWLTVSNPLMSLVTEGHTAVGLFMVLSGFVLARAAIGFKLDYWKFIQNRLLRIYPLFIVTILSGIAFKATAVPLDSLLVTLVPLGSIKMMADLGPFSNSLWAIPVEFQFYLLFPFLMLFSVRNGVRQLGLIIMTAILLRALIMASGGDMFYTSYFSIIGRIDEFVMGILGAYFVASRQKPVAVWVIVPVAVGCVVILSEYNHLHGYLSQEPWKVIWPTIQGLMWAAFIVAYMPVAHYLPKAVSRVMAAVGTVSFSMYLIHFVIVSIVAQRMSSSMFIDSNPFFVAFLIGLLVVLPVTIVVSRLTYAAIEEPFLRLRVKYLSSIPSLPEGRDAA